MDLKNLESNLGKDGYSVKLDHVVDLILTQSVVTNFLLTETLRSVIIIQRQMRNESTSDEDVDTELKEVASMVTEAALAKKASLIADLYLKNK